MGIGTTTPAAKLEVGGTANFDGAVTFAAGQTFPGTGTITQVAAGTDLTGGGTAGSVTLNLDTTKVPTLSAASNVFAGGISATSFSGSGTNVTNVNAAKLGGLLPAAFQPAGTYATTTGLNIFAGTQVISGGDLSITSGDLGLPQTTGSTAGVIALGGYRFVHACCLNSTFNTFVGRNAGNFTADSSLTNSGYGWNTAVGSSALHALTDGFANTAMGFTALYSNTTGAENTANGYQALYSNEDGGGNTASGYKALYSNASGDHNTAIGYQALSSNHTGTNNTATGYEALYLNKGTDNTATGFQALYLNVSGVNNTADGFYALHENDSGTENTATGVSALYSNTAGHFNTAVGESALGLNTTGGSNTAVGVQALLDNQTGEFNSGLGFQADVSSGGLSHATAIGACARVATSDSLVLGANPGACLGVLTANTRVGVDVSSPSNIFTVLQGGGNTIADGWDTYSSRRWKSNIHTLDGALGKVEQLRGVEYTYTASGAHDIGMIAEEVGKVVPEVVSYEANGKDARGIDYARLTALLVEVVKQQQAQIRQQQSQLAKQHSQGRQQQAEIRRLQSKVKALEGKKGQ